MSMTLASPMALTASVLPEERALCVEAGMDDYIAKPFSRHDLEAALERRLPKRGQGIEQESRVAGH